MTGGLTSGDMVHAIQVMNEIIALYETTLQDEEKAEKNYSEDKRRQMQPVTEIMKDLLADAIQMRDAAAAKLLSQARGLSQ